MGEKLQIKILWSFLFAILIICIYRLWLELSKATLITHSSVCKTKTRKQLYTCINIIYEYVLHYFPTIYWSYTHSKTFVKKCLRHLFYLCFMLQEGKCSLWQRKKKCFTYSMSSHKATWISYLSSNNIIFQGSPIRYFCKNGQYDLICPDCLHWVELCCYETFYQTLYIYFPAICPRSIILLFCSTHFHLLFQSTLILKRQIIWPCCRSHLPPFP